MAFRRGWVMLLVLAVLPVSQPAEASAWDNLWMTKDQQAQRQLDAGEPGGAAALFEDPEWQAVAQYRAGDYRESARNFAEFETTRSLYNLGNALARQGEFEGAIDAYDDVLEIDPGHEDARYNRDLVQQALQQKQQQQQQGGEGQSDQQDEGEQSGSGSESEQQNSDQSGQSEGEQGGNASQRDEEESQEDLEALQEELQRAAEEARRNQDQVAQQQLTAEELEALRRQQEQQEAMEQWLRRIPNDPGGLLRRKFRYQYQKSGKDQDGNNTWPDDEVQPW
jgi:Ca-activated chloride channel family protein